MFKNRELCTTMLTFNTDRKHQFGIVGSTSDLNEEGVVNILLNTDVIDATFEEGSFTFHLTEKQATEFTSKVKQSLIHIEHLRGLNKLGKLNNGRG